jgi:hypothetical protein
MSRIGLPPRRAVVLKARLRRDGAEYVSDLQLGPGHWPWTLLHPSS